MQVPLEVTFRNPDRSEAVETLVREEAAKLERHFGHIVSCRVTRLKAVRDAFKVANRQLENHARRLRGDVKSHAQ